MKLRRTKNIPLHFYFLQSGIIVFILFFVLYGLKHVGDIAILGTIGATSLGASGFIAFSAPSKPVAHFARMIGSYIVGCIIGVLCFELLHFLQQFIAVDWHHTREIISAFAVGITMLVLLLFNLEHPPAVGIALGLVFERWDTWTICIILAAILLIAVTKTLLKSWLKDLY